MRERKQNSVTFCFDSIAGKMAHRETRIQLLLLFLFTNMRTIVRQHWFEEGKGNILGFYTLYTKFGEETVFWRDASDFVKSNNVWIIIIIVIIIMIAYVRPSW